MPSKDCVMVEAVLFGLSSSGALSFLSTIKGRIVQQMCRRVHIQEQGTVHTIKPPSSPPFSLTLISLHTGVRPQTWQLKHIIPARSPASFYLYSWSSRRLGWKALMMHLCWRTDEWPLQADDHEKVKESKHACPRGDPPCFHSLVYLTMCFGAIWCPDTAYDAHIYSDISHGSRLTSLTANIFLLFLTKQGIWWIMLNGHNIMITHWGEETGCNKWILLPAPFQCKLCEQFLCFENNTCRINI